MKRSNLYIHYDSVTNHVLTMGFDWHRRDFCGSYEPENLILAEAPRHVGSFDAVTNFKILRGKEEVIKYLDLCDSKKTRLSNWIDFEDLELMHQLTPNEISELLYLFHMSSVLRSAFFYKLQNNYVYLTLPNGLQKTYYRHISHFSPRVQRVLTQHFLKVVNESNVFFFSKKDYIPEIPLDIVEKLSPYFSQGLKIDFAQAYEDKQVVHVPLIIIEDELIMLKQVQPQDSWLGIVSYDKSSDKWELSMNEN